MVSCGASGLQRLACVVCRNTVLFADTWSVVVVGDVFVKVVSTATFEIKGMVTKLCETIMVVMKTKGGMDKEGLVFVVTHIFEPIEAQPITVCVQDCEHLCQLKLGDSYSDSPAQVDVLIGSDYYWELTTGEIRCGNTGPVALSIK